MARLIKDRAVVEDQWLLVRDASEPNFLEGLDGQDVIVPLPVWLSQREAVSTRKGRTGVWLQSHELPQSIAEDLPSFAVIALEFPIFSDGRAYSSARELRENLGYKGELRAIGDVLCDQLFYMSRCGFNAFAMRPDQNLDVATLRFEDFKDGYQASVDKPIPLFRRRGG